MFKVLDKLAEVLAVSAFTVSSVFLFLNVLNRYLVAGFLRDLAKDYQILRPVYFTVRNFLGNIVVTADEVPGLLLVWVAFLGAYIAMRREGHISFDLILNSIPKVGRRFVEGFNAVLISGFLFLLFWQSIRLIRVSGRTEIETAHIAQGWFMLILPLSSVLLFLAVVQRFLNRKAD